MEHGYSILMFIFGGALLFYALLMMITGNVRLLPYHVRDKAKMEHPKQYIKNVGKIIALVALAPVLSGACGYIGHLNNTPVPMAVLIGLAVIFIIIGTKIFKTNTE